ncbi:MAG: T9SS type A sorting domain-containing protein, partial [Bacteroidota bacterium]
MRKLFTLFVLFLTLGLTVQAQKVLEGGRTTSSFKVENPESGRMLPTANANDLNRTVTCPQDTNLYIDFKSVNLLELLSFDGAFIPGYGQYFPASPTNPVTVSGFFFLSSVNDMMTVSTTIDCRAYNAGSDSLATGAPVASTTVTIDTSFTTFASVTYEATFATPVTFTNPFVLSAENNTPVSAVIFVTNIDSADGQGEFLASILDNGTWVSSSDIAFNSGPGTPSTPFDSDVLMRPKFSYDVTAEATVQGGADCVLPNETVTFDANAVTELALNPIYNRLANPNSSFFDTLAIYSLDAADGSGASNGSTLATTYSATGNYDVKATVNVLLYSGAGLCSDTATLPFQVANAPSAGFNVTTIDSTNKAITVESSSLDAESVTFFLGTDSVAGSPATFVTGAPGTFDITIVATGCGRTDTFTESVVIPELASINGELANEVKVYPNPTSGEVNVELENIAGEVNVVLRNIIGQEVLRTSGYNRISFDISGMEPGIYLLEGEV